jgi:flagellar basal-body rod protein FlgC
MSSFKIFDIAGSALSAQSVRLNTVASNLANANTVSGDKESVYKARYPVFETVIAGVGRDAGASASVRVTEVIESEKAPLARYEPGNPVADADGFVYAPDINPVEQMVDMISASRSYQNSIEVMNSSKEMLLATLRLGQ